MTGVKFNHVNDFERFGFLSKKILYKYTSFPF